jgi:hypothetical protein
LAPQPLKEAREVVHAEIDLAKNSPQSSSIEFTMRWHHRLGKLLATNPKFDALKGCNDLLRSAKF